MSFSQFMNWFVELNCEASQSFNHTLEISDKVDIGDRGLVACREFSDPENYLLAISVDDPRLVLSPTRAHYLLNQCCCSFASDWKSTINSNPQHPQDILSLFFFHLKCAEHTEKCELWKLWKPYFLILPETFTDVAFVSSVNPDLMNEIMSTLPSSLKSAFKSRIIRMSEAYKRLFFDPKIPSPPISFAWSWSAVNSRCVYVNLSASEMGKPIIDEKFPCKVKFIPKSKKDIAVVPFFDFFNHSPDVSANIEVLNHVLYLKTDAKYTSGEQVFINYGKHDNLFLLCEYGFCIPGLGNSSDAIYPTYENLLSMGFQNKLHDVLSILQLFQTKSRDSTWKSVFISADGPSYYLVLILFAIFSEESEIPSADILFNIDETNRCEAVSLGIERLRSLLIEETETSLKALDSLCSNHRFVDLTRCLLDSRLTLLRYFK